VPTTVVVGALDVPCFLDMADVLAGAIPGARKVVVPHAGHMVNMEAPAAVNAVLREVIRSV
jgi:3-oxoadipate enol-lactonase